MKDEYRKLIESALLQVADNVAKHTVTRSGFSHDDSCFQVDLTQSQSQIESLIHTLELEHLTTSDELRLTRLEVVAQTQAKDLLRKEVQRLKEGRFTDEEFQALCHVFPPEKVCAFRRGCLSYQSQLFGEEEVKAEVARELRWALHRVSYAYGLDGLAEGMAAAIVDHDHLKPSC